jgi:hypothetical protein
MPKIFFSRKRDGVRQQNQVSLNQALTKSGCTSLFEDDQPMRKKRRVKRVFDKVKDYFRSDKTRQLSLAFEALDVCISRSEEGGLQSEIYEELSRNSMRTSDASNDHFDYILPSPPADVEVEADIEARTTSNILGNSSHRGIKEDHYHSMMGQSGGRMEEKASQCRRLVGSLQQRKSLLQQQTEQLHSLKEDLAAAQCRYGRCLLALEERNARHLRSHIDLTDRHSHLQSRFEDLNSYAKSKSILLNATQDRLQLEQAALQKIEAAYKDLRVRHDYMVAEKARDYSWHVAKNANAWALRPMNVEDQIADATQDLRQRLEEQIETSIDLSRQLDSAKVSRKAKSKKLKRVISKQNQENAILEMALKMVQDQRDHWTEQYDQMIVASASKFTFQSYTRGIAERHILVQQRWMDLERQLVEATLRGNRAVLNCETHREHEIIKLKKRDDRIGDLQRKVEGMKHRLGYESSMALMYKETVEKEMPDLEARNREIEDLLRDQVENNSHTDHRALFTDLHSRLDQLKSINTFWEQELNLQLQEHSALKNDWNLFGANVQSDLAKARGWLRERDDLALENAAFRSRFRHELHAEPLEIPPSTCESSTSGSRSDALADVDAQKLESIDDLLLKQFAYTFGSVPRSVVDETAPPWEWMRANAMEDMEVQRARWIAELESARRDEKVEVEVEEGEAQEQEQEQVVEEEDPTADFF